MKDLDPEYCGRTYRGVSIICKNQPDIVFYDLEVTSDCILAIAIEDADGRNTQF